MLFVLKILETKPVFFILYKVYRKVNNIITNYFFNNMNSK